MTRDQQRQMRNAIDTVELALSHMDIETMVQKFEGADDTVMVKVPLEQLRVAPARECISRAQFHYQRSGLHPSRGTSATLWTLTGLSFYDFPVTNSKPGLECRTKQQHQSSQNGADVLQASRKPDHGSKSAIAPA